MEYMGKRDPTKRGSHCWPWILYLNDLWSNKFPEGNIDEAANYCINPTNDKFGPWCYHDVYRYLCALPICSMKDTDNDIYIKYPYDTLTKQHCHMLVM